MSRRRWSGTRAETRTIRTKYRGQGELFAFLAARVKDVRTWSAAKKDLTWNRRRCRPASAASWRGAPAPSLKRPWRPLTDLGWAANKWECSFIGRSQLQPRLFEKIWSENGLFVFPLMSLQPYLHTQINYTDFVPLLFLLGIALHTSAPFVFITHRLLELYWIFKSRTVFSSFAGLHISSLLI